MGSAGDPFGIYEGAGMALSASGNSDANTFLAALMITRGGGDDALKLLSAEKGIFNSASEGLTNGTYTVSQEAMKKHVFGGVSGKSLFYPTVNANEAVLKAAQYADENALWIGNKAKVPVSNTNIGTLGNRTPTNVINVYKNSKGAIHGSPGTAR